MPVLKLKHDKILKIYSGSLGFRYSNFGFGLRARPALDDAYFSEYL